VIRIIFIMIVLFCANIAGQNLSAEWVPVDTKENSKVFFNKQTIKVFGNKIAVYVLEVFNKPVLNESTQLNTASAKTYYFFYVPKKKFTIIGSIFYDVNGSMTGETRNPAPTSIDDQFPYDTENDADVKAIYTGIINYLDENNISYEGKETNSDKWRPSVTEVTNDVSQVVKNEPKEEPKNKEKEKPKSNSSGAGYDEKNERVARGTIFTDGETFIIQVSSWQDRNKANSEAQKMTRSGHNAFVTEAYVPQKGGIWYRVRVGYFTSLNDAEKYQRSNNLR